MSLIINESKVTVPGVATTSWHDSNQLKQVTDKNARSAWIRGIVCHSVHGKLGRLLPGAGQAGLAKRYANYQTNTDRYVSWDYTCDLDGSWLVQNDPLKYYTWHATAVNPITVGFELAQLDNGDMYDEQIKKAVLFVDALTALLGVQRQIPWDFKNDKPWLGQVNRIAGSQAGRDVVGIYAHVNQTNNRGPGDPGPWLFYALRDAGYKLFDYDKGEDKLFWEEQQRKLGFVDCDGVAGPRTVSALKASGYAHGMIVHRPIDDQLVVGG